MYSRRSFKRVLIFLFVMGSMFVSHANPDISINNVDGGTIEGGDFTFCTGDGQVDTIAIEDLTLSGVTGTNSSWVLTNDAGIMIAFPDDYSSYNFEPTGGDTCFMYHLSYEDDVTDLGFGLHKDSITGCFDYSNPVTIFRNLVDGGTLTGGPFNFLAGDGNPDIITSDLISISDVSGNNTTWVVTDDNGLVLMQVDSLSQIDFEEAGAGVCIVWHVAYEDGWVAPEIGSDFSDLTGCFDASNPVIVFRNEIIGGELQGGPFDFCVGDGVADTIPSGGIILIGSLGSFSQWVVTDPNGTILGLPAFYEQQNFDELPGGSCLIWNMVYEAGLTGLEIGEQVENINGSFNFSNPIEIFKTPISGGELEGEHLSFILGDGVSDMIAPEAISVSNTIGTNTAWVITNVQGEIESIPDDYSTIDFETSEGGLCFLWNISYEDGLSGLTEGNEIEDLMGCFALSDSIVINRQRISGGTLAGGPYSFCVSDGVADFIPEGTIAVIDSSGMNRQWVITEADGTIADLPDHYTVVDFDGTGAGECFLWMLAYLDGIEGLEIGSNVANISGPHDFSNSISIFRAELSGGSDIEGGPFTFCVGDGEADMIADGAITLLGTEGTNNDWVLTTEGGSIVSIHDSYQEIDFDNGNGNNLNLYFLVYEDGIQGYSTGANISNLGGCFSLSNGLEVEQNQVSSATLEGGPFTFCTNDGVEDFILDEDIIITDTITNERFWVITDETARILDFKPALSDFEFDNSGEGTAFIYLLSYSDIEGLEVLNFIDDLAGCFGLSNAILINRVDCTPPDPSAAIINEIAVGSVIELYNGSDEEVDLVKFRLSNGSSAISIPEMDIVCGEDNYILSPGEYISVTAPAFIDGAQGELAIYFLESIYDYVQWGTDSQNLTSEAIETGQWTEGLVYPSYNANNSLSLQENTDPSPIWEVVDPTPCEVNATVSSVASIFGATVQIFPNPFADFLMLRLDQSMEIESTRLLTLDGRLITTFENCQGKLGECYLSMTDEIGAGFYFLELTANGATERFQIIKI